MLVAYSMGSKDAVGFAFLDDVIETWAPTPSQFCDSVFIEN